MVQDLILLSKYAKRFGHTKICALGINDTEYSICTFLYFHPSVYQNLVATVLMIDKTTVAKALNNLVEDGLILREQDADNRRKNRLNITALGREKIHGVIAVYDEWMDALIGCLSSDEQAVMTHSLKKLVEKAKQLEDVDTK